MSAPQHDPQQWGSGIPGIPSIWDVPRGGDGEQQPHVWTAPPRPRRPPAGAPSRDRGAGAEHRSAQRLAAGLVGGVALLLLVLGGGMTSGGYQEVVEGPVAVPAPVFDPGASGPLEAARVDGDSPPRGLPLGVAARVTDPATAASLEVRPRAAATEGELVLIEVELVAVAVPDGSGTQATVPELVLRGADRREARWSEVRWSEALHGSHGTGTPPDGGWPTVLLPGESWRGEVAFPAVGPGAVLVALGPGPVADWVLPPA